MNTFENAGMDTRAALAVLAALAHEARLATFRLLVQAGPAGMAPTRIAETLGMPASSLSFHLKELSHAGLVRSRQAGRFLLYSARFDSMEGLVGFLTDNCCRDAAAGTPATACGLAARDTRAACKDR
jgi:ArsR family transcriptional regulator